MSNRTIPLDKVQSEIAQINLNPKLEELLSDFSTWSAYQQEDWNDHFLDYSYGSESGIIYRFLTQYSIGIRPSGFEFYLIEKDSCITGESSFFAQLSKECGPTKF